MKKRVAVLLIFLLLVSGLVFYMNKKGDFNPSHKIGDAIDSLNHVKCFTMEVLAMFNHEMSLTDTTLGLNTNV